MGRVCPDCGADMRERDVGVARGQRKVLSSECDHCGNIEVASHAAAVMRRESRAAARNFVVHGNVEKLADGGVSVRLDRDAARKAGLRPGREVILRAATGESIEVAPP